jgi:glycosyltransferase involved in cell wall biosynthesis
VVPMRDEEANIDELVGRLGRVLGSSDRPWELVAVDDGSEDGTWPRLTALRAGGAPIRALRLSRSFGKEGAICAGLEAARGRAVVIMDGDLQHPPELIAEMVRLWSDGYDVVDAVKSNRGREPLIQRLSAAAFYRLLGLTSGIDLAGASDFKLLDRRALDAWSRLPERTTFFRGLSAWIGFRRTTVSFEVPERSAGRSAWSLGQRFRLAFDAITAFSTVPLVLVTWLGVLFLGFAAVLGVQTLVMKFSGRAVDGFATVNLLILIAGGSIMAALGVIGQYLGRIYEEVKGRPRYLLSESLGDDDS